MSDLKELVNAFCEEVDRSLMENPYGGQTVGNHRGDFQGAKQLPSVAIKLKWWVRAFRELTEKEPLP